MSDSTLIAHCGARVIERDELDKIEPPPCTKTFRPIKHAVVLDRVREAMSCAGFEPHGMKIATTRDHQRLFATIDTQARLGDGGVALAVAVVNSTDKSLPMKFVAGSRVNRRLS